MKFPNLVVSVVIKIEVGPSLPIITAEPKSFPKMYEGTNNAGAKIIVRIANRSKAIIAFFNVETPMLTMVSGAAIPSGPLETNVKNQFLFIDDNIISTSDSFFSNNIISIEFGEILFLKIWI